MAEQQHRISDAYLMMSIFNTSNKEANLSDAYDEHF